MMAETAEPERTNTFLIRFNLEPSTRLTEMTDQANQNSLSATDELLGAIGQAITRIERTDTDGAGAALHELWASLLDLKVMAAHNPGISSAADDLYASVAALLLDESAAPAVLDVRRWWLLREVDAQLRARLPADERNESARLSAPN